MRDRRRAPLGEVVSHPRDGKGELLFGVIAHHIFFVARMAEW